MALEITGKIYKIGNEVTGESKTGNAWKKVEFAIEFMDGQYPRKAAFTLMGERIESIKKYNVGDNIKVSFNVESREWQDKFFTDLRAWRIEPGEGGSGQSAPSATQQAATPSTANYSDQLPKSEETDDLPF